MDKQLSMIKKYLMDRDTIAYIHENEIILIKHEPNREGEDCIFEYRLDYQTGRCLQKRRVPTDELAPEAFDGWHKYFQHLTQTMLRRESAETRIILVHFYREKKKPTLTSKTCYDKI